MSNANSNRNFLLINGSRAGADGNTSALLSYMGTRLEKHGTLQSLELSRVPSTEVIESSLRAASAVVIGTGTYWDSWGSPLQRFLEDMSHTEGTECWLGKPVAIVVTMHSVGGKEVLSRLMGVLNTFGAMIPPMCGLVYSAVSQVALQGGENVITDDLWRPSDLDVVCHNLVESCNNTRDWISWPVEREHMASKWYQNS